MWTRILRRPCRQHPTEIEHCKAVADVEDEIGMILDQLPRHLTHLEVAMTARRLRSVPRNEVEAAVIVEQACLAGSRSGAASPRSRRSGRPRRLPMMYPEHDLDAEEGIDESAVAPGQTRPMQHSPRQPVGASAILPSTSGATTISRAAFVLGITAWPKASP